MVFANPDVEIAFLRVVLGITFLLAVVFGEYLKLRTKAKKGFNWLTLAGVWFLFAGTFGIATSLGTYLTTPVWNGLEQVFEILAWIFALVGTLFVAYELLVEK